MRESSRKIDLRMSGGGTTVFDLTPNAFSHPLRNMDNVERMIRFNIGRDFFKRPWISKRATTTLRDGLGPHFNNNACEHCHVRNGRGSLSHVASAELGQGFPSLIFRASRQSVSLEQAHQMRSGVLMNVPDSAVGAQLQHRSIHGVRNESSIDVTYRSKTVTFFDGHQVHLRQPNWIFKSLYADQGIDFDSDSVFSARVTPPMIGLGLLEMIPEQVIVRLADPEDKDGDGISGRVNTVWDVRLKKTRLGRFGWKAGQPNVEQQVASAFHGDLGLRSELFNASECLAHQVDCLEVPNGNGDDLSRYPYEVSSKVLQDVVFYAQNLAVPARRQVDKKTVKQGEHLFKKASCDACHVPQFKTQRLESKHELSDQVIFPYTDMLLHDMGAELADVDRSMKPVRGDVLVEFSATTREWRTPPLWGIGLAKTVNPDAVFLHDGRARTVLEAVLWHGGEAEKSKRMVLGFSQEERSALLAFLHDL
ncbi:MAG: di-heme oxidoredictase family protein [Pseudomonadota bacterium]